MIGPFEDDEMQRNVQREIDGMVAELKRLTLENVSLEHKVAELRALADDNDRTIAALKFRIDNLKEELEALYSRNDELRMRIEGMKA